MVAAPDTDTLEHTLTHSERPSVLLSELGFTWPDGTPALRGLTAAFGPGRTGLTGANGAGKTTLLKLIAGQLTPSSGTVTVTGDVGYLPQHLTPDATTADVADLLGVGQRLAALRAIEAGSTDPAHFEMIGEDWDIVTRAEAALDAAGLGSLNLDRPVHEISGGEAVLAALTGLRLAATPVVLLDEPTNNLDIDTRHRLYDSIRTWPGALIVVSHDTALLDLMDDTAELHGTGLHLFGGTYSEYQEHLATEQAAAEQSLRSAEQSLKQERRQRVEAETRLARRRSYARTDYRNKRRPKIIMNLRKSEAQVSAGKLRDNLDARVREAEQEVTTRAARLRSDDSIRIELPDPAVPAGRRLAELGGPEARIVLRGPEKVALTGPNGVGKTRLLESLVHDRPGPVPAIRHTGRIGYLPQRLDHLTGEATVIDTVREAAPDSSPQQVRANLARFLFTAAEVDRQVGELSGGERFRVALARLLLATPPNQLLVLDEPTNNLDLASVDELVDALGAYRGALLVVSHDERFLLRLGIDTWLTLTEQSLVRRDEPEV